MGDHEPTMRLGGVGPHTRHITICYALPAKSLEVATQWLEVLADILCTNIEAGTFPSVAGDISHKSPSMLELEAPANNDQILYRLLTNGIDIGALQCLRNMVRRLRRERIAIKRIDVLDAETSAGLTQTPDWPSEATELHAYPQAHQKLLSFLEYSGSDFGKSRRCLVELGHSLTTDDVLLFERAVQPWYRLIEMGGYAMPIGFADEIDTIAGSVSQFDEHTIEITVNRFVASEMAWVGLGNAAVAFWEPIGKLVRIAVE